MIYMRARAHTYIHTSCICRIMGIYQSRDDHGGRGSGRDNNNGVVVAMDEMSTSPKNKVKLLCSHGGKILPRTSDGQLKYVGGETRVITIPRDVSYSGYKPTLPQKAKILILT